MTTIHEYIAAQPPGVRTILKRIRRGIHDAVTDAEEGISYRMPIFKRHGVLVYFAVPAVLDGIGYVDDLLAVRGPEGEVVGRDLSALDRANGATRESDGPRLTIDREYQSLRT